MDADHLSRAAGRAANASRLLISQGSTFEEQIGYSRAVAHGPWVWVAGTTGYDYATMTLPESIEDQVTQALSNVEDALHQAGAGLADVVRVRYLVPERDDFPRCWPALRRAFGDSRPAATMQVCGLAEAAMRIEIEVTAYAPDRERAVGAGPS